MRSVTCGPADLPWSEKKAYLLLNALNLPNPAKTVYQTQDRPQCDYLFNQTRFEKLPEKSPILVTLSGRYDPLYQRFIEHAEQEWGLLLFSQSDFRPLMKHLRWLMFIGEPLRYLNFSDPLVANALYGLYPVHTDNRLFGPIDEIHAIRLLPTQWQRHMRQGEVLLDHSTPHLLNPEQQRALGESNFTLLVRDLETHMRTFFPDYLPDASAQQRFDQLHAMAEQGYQAGFKSESDLFHYANVRYYLDGQPADAHPDIRSLLSTPSAQTPSQRIQLANDLVVERALAQEEARSETQPGVQP